MATLTIAGKMQICKIGLKTKMKQKQVDEKSEWTDDKVMFQLHRTASRVLCTAWSPYIKDGANALEAGNPTRFLKVV